MTPQEAEFLRDRRPHTFAEIQRNMVQHIDAIQENTDFDTQTRLTIFFGVPVNSLASKQKVDFFQNQFADRAAEDQKPVDFKANALKPETPTQTQNLQSR
jgi:hypothetical protein